MEAKHSCTILAEIKQIKLIETEARSASQMAPIAYAHLHDLTDRNSSRTFVLIIAASSTLLSQRLFRFEGKQGWSRPERVIISMACLH